MRKCLRCSTEMIEDMAIKVYGAGYGIEVKEKGLFKNRLMVKCAVCPQCGYLETYVDIPRETKK